MRAHPIPQNVVTFEDKIFGPLTAKQFAIIATGFSLDFVIFMGPLPTLYKLPIIGVVSLFSLVAGLIKINGMYFDAWLLTFIAAIYAPTQFVWEKEANLSFLTLDFSENKNKKASSKNLSTTRTAELKRELYPGLYSDEEEKDVTEEEFLSQLNFELPLPAKISIESTTQTKTTPITEDADKMEAIQMIPEKPTSDVEISPFNLPELQKTVGEESSVSSVWEKKTEVKPEVQESEIPLEQIEKQETMKENPEQPQAPATVTQLASDISISQSPILQIPIAGRTSQLKPTLSNLKINRTLNKQKLQTQQLIFPVRGEKQFSISQDLEKRIEEENKQIKNIEILQIEKEPDDVQTVPIPPMPEQTAVELPEEPAIEQLKDKDILMETITPVVEQTEDKPEIVTNTQKIVPLHPLVEEKQIIDAPKSTESIPDIKEEPIHEVQKNSPDENHNMPESIIPPPPQTTSTPSATQSAVDKATIRFLTKASQFLPPQVPNIVAGIIKDTEGKSITNVIILIKDVNGNPVRALKTNRLGQFSIATPLPNGNYRLEFEKEGCQFDTFDLELNGALVPIIEINAKSVN